MNIRNACENCLLNAKECEESKVFVCVCVCSERSAQRAYELMRECASCRHL